MEGSGLPGRLAGDQVSLSKPVLVAIDVVAWGFFHSATGYLVHRLPLGRFDGDNWLYRSRPLEANGRLYTRVLRIKRWKGLLPEAGALFEGGFDKKQLAGAEDDYLSRFLAETRRAELGHWLCVAAAPLFFAWNPAWIAAVMIPYALAANGPCIAAQRYNRIRLRRVLAARRRR